MIGGVSFQPGQMSGGAGQQVRPKSGNSVQEAIKILSLRLPKQVGPNALAPSALLNAQGSNGNPRVDSVVNTVLSRMMPQGPAPGGAPVLGPSGGDNGTMPPSSPIRYDGNTRPTDNTPLSSMMQTDYQPTQARDPRITPAEGGGNFWQPDGVQGAPGGPERPADAPKQQIDTVEPARPGPPQLFDNNPPPQAAPEPTQDPWADLMEYLRRREPAPPQESFSI